ncbi:hypothetical protein GCM10027569_49720 [Flindersiella endophytica]
MPGSSDTAAAAGAGLTSAAVTAAAAAVPTPSPNPRPDGFDSMNFPLRSTIEPGDPLRAPLDSSDHRQLGASEERGGGSIE